MISCSFPGEQELQDCLPVKGGVFEARVMIRSNYRLSACQGWIFWGARVMITFIMAIVHACTMIIEHA